MAHQKPQNNKYAWHAERPSDDVSHKSSRSEQCKSLARKVPDQNQSNFLSTASNPTVVTTIRPAAMAVAWGDSIHGRPFVFIP
jgi:hypothetical protein